MSLYPVVEVNSLSPEGTLEEQKVWTRFHRVCQRESWYTSDDAPICCRSYMDITEW